MKVRNMKSSRGNTIATQFIISVDTGDYFQSYDSVIAFKPHPTHLKYGKKVTLDNKWDYSVTTGKYRNQFLGESKKETEKKIKSGEYILTDLNK